MMGATTPVWLDVCADTEVPTTSARKVNVGATQIGVFRAGDGSLFALVDKCPHKGGPLSDGIVHGHSVTCPLHSRSFSLKTGEGAQTGDGCARTVALKLEAGRVLLDVSGLPG